MFKSDTSDELCIVLEQGFHVQVCDLVWNDRKLLTWSLSALIKINDVPR